MKKPKNLCKKRYTFWISPKKKEYLDKRLSLFGWSFEDYLFYTWLFIDKKELFKSYARKKAIESMKNGERNPITLIKFLDELERRLK